MDETQPDQVGAAGRSSYRGRLLLAVFAAAALVVAAVSVLRSGDGSVESEAAFAGDSASTAESAEPVIDVVNFPRGALSGEPAPDILVLLFDGSEFVLSQHLSGDGRPVVLNLWASWCTPCRREIPEFSRVALANPGVAFVGAAVEDARGPAEAFAAEVEASYPMGIDEHLTIKDGYPFVGLPVTYLIGSDGTVARQIQGQLNAATLQAFIDHDLDV